MWLDYELNLGVFLGFYVFLYFWFMMFYVKLKKWIIIGLRIMIEVELEGIDYFFKIFILEIFWFVILNLWLVLVYIVFICLID